MTFCFFRVLFSSNYFSTKAYRHQQNPVTETHTGRAFVSHISLTTPHLVFWSHTVTARVQGLTELSPNDPSELLNPGLILSFTSRHFWADAVARLSQQESCGVLHRLHCCSRQHAMLKYQTKKLERNSTATIGNPFSFPSGGSV